MPNVAPVSKNEWNGNVSNHGRDDAEHYDQRERIGAREGQDEQQLQQQSQWRES